MLPFCDWLTSLSVLSRFYAVACIRISFLYKAEQYSTFYLSIYLTTDTCIAPTWLAATAICSYGVKQLAHKPWRKTQPKALWRKHPRCWTQLILKPILWIS